MVESDANPARNDSSKRPASRRWRDDLDAIALTMAATLRDAFEGWGNVSASDIAIEDHSGHGGGRAYKLTNRANPAAPAAALHILHEGLCPAPEDPIYFDRERLGQEVLSEAGLTPARIADDPGKEWFVEEWYGDGAALEKATLERVEEIAQLLARAHATDAGWYEEIRERQRHRHPELQDAPEHSHVWSAVSFEQHHPLDRISAQQFRMWITAGPVPATEAGSRLVTTHGDRSPGNIVRGRDGLRFIDMESACVAFAVHDLCSFVSVAERLAPGWNDDLNRAFTRAYLEHSNMPALAESVFALRLDVERHKAVSSLWETVNEREGYDDLGAGYARLVAIADRALVDRELAEEIVERGFMRCNAVRQALREAGRPWLGTLVAIHRHTPEPAGRVGMVIHWDGTIQSTLDRRLGLVLGLKGGEVVLANCCDEERRLQLRMLDGEIPITGCCAPTSVAVPLRLIGRHAGKALVVSRTTRHPLGNSIEHVKVGPVEDALEVHLEADGIIRLADRPHQAFHGERSRVITGTRISIFHNHCAEYEKFVVNDDATVSLIANPEAVMGMRRDQLLLVSRDDPYAECLRFSEEFTAAARVGGPSTWADGDPPTRDEGHLLDLASHPGLALSAETREGHHDVRHLSLVPAESAERFVVARDHVRLADGGGTIALGTSMSSK